MNNKTPAIVRRVLVQATKEPRFFELSDAQRLNWMLEKAYRCGRESVKSRRVRRASPNRTRGASLEVVVQLRPARPVYSGRRK